MSFGPIDIARIHRHVKDAGVWTIHPPGDPDAVERVAVEPATMRVLLDKLDGLEKAVRELHHELEAESALKEGRLMNDGRIVP